MRITPGLIILVGPPASGKSTFVREMIAAGRLDPEAVVSTDTIRAELYGDDPVGFDSDLADPLVFAERDRRIVTRLAAGHYAVAESTNVTAQARRRLIAIAEEFGAPVTVLRFVQDIPLSARSPARAELERVDRGLGALADLPVLVAWGMRDWCFTPRYLDGWRRRFPGARVAELPGAGHCLLEDGGEAAEAMEAFLGERGF